MKIILSPSKTASYQNIPELPQLELYDEKKTKKLVSTIRKFNQKDLGKALKVSGDLCKQTHKSYQNYYKSDRYQAFPSFTGLVYKQLHLNEYRQEEYDYIQKHVRILDALYGVLTPGTTIKPYRLDMKASIGISLYKYWHLQEHFKGETIINLASKEFSSMLDVPLITIEFYENKNGSLRTLATYSKMARGKMLDYMIQHHITNPEELKQFNEDNYRYDSQRSTEDQYVFIR